MSLLDVDLQDRWAAIAHTWPALHNIDNAPAFVQACIIRSRLVLTPTEREDLHADGLSIIKELAVAFDGRGDFAGYAAKYLPGRMQDAHRARNPQHRRVTKDGRRVRTYGEHPISLQADDAPNVATMAIDQTLTAHELADVDPTRIPLVASAMSLMAVDDQFTARRIIGHLYDGHGVDDVAALIKASRGRITSVRDSFYLAVRQAQADALEHDAA